VPLVISHQFPRNGVNQQPVSIHSLVRCQEVSVIPKP
jgi:hypothetical protein